MKVTNKILLILVMAAFTCCDTDDNTGYSNDNGQFVRFFLQLDRNNQPIEAPAIAPTTQAISEFNKNDATTIKIPVALTSQPVEEITVDYSVQLNNLNNIEITPSTLSFSGTQLVDTLFVEVNERWDASTNPSLFIELTEVSDENIKIGMPNDVAPLDQLTINFNHLELNYSIITSPNTVPVSGINGDFYDITVGFQNGFLSSEIDGIDLLQETQSNFNYTITQLPITNSREITYRVTLDQDFTDDDLLYKTSFALAGIPNYSINGFSTISLSRLPITPRDINLNTASNFYNTADAFYRTYGVNWMDFNEDGICEWRDFNAFTVPVEVPATDPNAILGDDMGTTDTSDDLYYHAFRIGFEPPNSNTTNSFNLRRWFTNESTSASNSPGFNVSPALEFFPDEITPSSGIVQVVEQTILIGTSASNGSISEFIDISGNGTFSEISPGVYEIILDFNATNNRLFGGTRTVRYHFYNTSNFLDPPLLNDACFTPQAL
ncbi:hypothetical protein LX97_03424 [Nonlabens dokdonensis]|uniref:Uncharacterized protein n=2 Tax=Nonlabens dokdonensis TaxID=328515 RepID=L7WCF7_NONDD|nr:hypothetical protein [Nonlabens dokdonensis]AGC77897.1 hypothetical protein DDD_2770 [Nonlabens dokdonensis DSW-6]PZX36667.1 hypothetical protein LX97_03424 [Nonlabens dokdonensis]